jgi:hypothetical protein
MHSENIRKRGHNCNPLLQVPPASRGNRTGARLGSPREAGGEPAGAGKGTAIRFRNTVLQGNFFPTRGMESPLTPTLSPLDKAWYGYRMWIEQGFRWLKRGCFGWHRCRVGSAAGIDWLWLVYALGCLLAAREGQLAGREVGLWDRRRRSASVLLLGVMSLVVKCWRTVISVDSEILSFSSGGEPE